ESREAALRAQQNVAQEALIRQATMAKVNDTLKFTDAESQGREKTPQQIMAEEATAKLAAKAGEVKTADTSAALGVPAPQQVSYNEEVKTTVPNAVATPVLQQLSKWDNAQAKTTA